MQAIVAGIVAVPLVWFYVTEIAIPLYEIETISLKRQNEETALELQKREVDFQTRLSALVQEKESQERNYLGRLAHLEEQKADIEKERLALKAQYENILNKQEISEDIRQSMEIEARSLQIELEASRSELEEIREDLKDQVETASSAAEAVAGEFERLRPVLTVDSDFYTKSEALIISVEKTASDKLSDLPGARIDAQIIAETLEIQGFSVRKLHNPEKADIERALVTLTQHLGPDDRLLLYWVGHGFPVEQANQSRGYFVPSDCQPETLENCMPMEVVTDFLERIGARSAAAFIDTSYANLAFASTRGLKISGPVLGPEAEVVADSREIISATNAGGLAFDMVHGSSGPIAKAIETGLGDWNADFNEDGIIRMRELYQYVTADVSLSTGGRQIPTYASLIPNGGEMIFFRQNTLGSLR